MDFFFHWFTAPLLRYLVTRSVLEIGADKGEHTDLLLSLPIDSISVVDPCVDADLRSKYEQNWRVSVEVGPSLDVLPRLASTFGCIVIDGDHNWYTVFNELRLIYGRKLLSDGGVILFHDVGWPYGRRDMYYDPRRIPAEHRQQYARRGIVPGVSELSNTGACNAHLDNALLEGGPKNGVLTAVEDFMKHANNRYVLRTVDEQHGLGILIEANEASLIAFVDNLIIRRAKERRGS